jgi:hypothetical protein
MDDDRQSQACFLAEVFTPGREAEQRRADADYVRAAAEALARAGTPVRYLESLYVPGEEIALYLFRADRPDEVEHVLHEAGLEAERISLATAIAGTPKSRKR